MKMEMTVHGIELDEFTVGYLTTALWSSTYDTPNEESIPIDQDFDITDCSLELIQAAKTDCLKFQGENTLLLDESCLDSEDQGHNFWLTRNGHGAGFWDRDLGEIGDKLSEASKAYGEFHITVMDDEVVSL